MTKHTVISFQPRPSTQGTQAMAAFLGVAAQACLSRHRGFQPVPRISLELFGNADAVRFALVASSRALAEQLRRELLVSHPGAAVTLSDQDHLPRHAHAVLAQLELTNSAALPIGTDGDHLESLASLISALSQLQDREFALLQLLLRPITRTTWTSYFRGLLDARGANHTVDRNLKAAVFRKATQPGFAAQIRLLTIAQNERAAKHHLQALLTALAPFVGPWNGLKRARPPFSQLSLRLAVHERQAGFLSPVAHLSAGELALLFHAPDLSPSSFPKLDLGRRAPVGPPPRHWPPRGRLLGQTPAEQRPLYLPPASRERHLLLLGPTGSGKTHTMVNLILQDIAAGRGCSLLTPSPDAIRRILRRVPPNQHQRIVLVRFADPDWSFGLNPLSQEGVDSWRIASELVAIWERLYPQFWGPLVSDIFKHGVMALTEHRGSSLLELVDLLEDPDRRQHLLPQISDPMIRRYWERFDDLGLSRQETRTRSSLNKIRAPLIIPWLRRTLGMPNSLSVRRVMDERLVVLWDLSNLADEGKLLGALIASQYFQAGLNRADQPEEQRVPHYLYADEWQSWPTTAWSKGLDLLRQFKVGLTLAGQRLDQISDELRQAALANVGSALVWGLRSDADASTMAKWLITPGLETSDLKRLGRYQTYARLLLDGEPTPGLSLETLPLPPEVPDADLQEQRLLALCHRRYYRPAVEVDRELERRHDRANDDPQSRPRQRRSHLRAVGS